MEKTDIWRSYEKRLSRVTDYIYEHLDDEIDLTRLAEVACLSPYHWHRIYRAIHGETITMTVRRLRLHRAASYLANTSMPIAEIATRSGYKSLQSFTRVFSAVFGLPPAQYRKAGSHTVFNSTGPEQSPTAYDVTIRTIPPFTVMTVDHVGSYMDVGKAFDRVAGWLGSRGLLAPDARLVGIYYDDPDAVPEEDLRSRAGVVATGNIDLEPPLQHTDVYGGPYAVLRYKGPYADMRAAYRWLYGDWLAQSGREPADAPIFEEYISNPRDTAPMDLLTDICLPLN